MKENNDTCRVFVSRRREDGLIFGTETDVLSDLEVLGRDRLVFWDMAKIDIAKPWRAEIDEQLLNSHLLLLILTLPALDDFNWPIYEASRFGGMHHPNRRRMVCLYPAGQSMPDVLGDIQGVTAELGAVRDLLLRMYTDSDFTDTKEPINGKVRKETVTDLAQQICDAINGPFVDEIQFSEYINPYLQVDFCFPKERRKEALEDQDQLQSIIKNGRVSPIDDSLEKMFGLQPNNRQRQRWTWGELNEEIAKGVSEDPQKFNRQWMEELEAMVENHFAGYASNRQIEGGFLASDGNVWQPEVEKICSYKSGRVSVELSFSPRPHQSWMRNDDTPAAGLAANLMLGSRIRQQLIEESERLFKTWSDDPDAVPKGVTELRRLVNGLQRDGFFIDRLTRGSLAAAFDEGDRKVLRKIDQEFRENIGGPLHRALEACDVDELEKAIRRWKVNNTNFLRIALRRYSKICGIASRL